MALLAVQVPEYRRIIGIGIIAHTQFAGPFLQLVGMFELRGTGHRNPRQVTFDVGYKDRYAVGGKTLGQPLKRDGFAGAGGASDQAVPVGAGQSEALPFAAAQSEKNFCRIGHWRIPSIVLQSCAQLDAKKRPASSTGLFLLHLFRSG